MTILTMVSVVVVSVVSVIGLMALAEGIGTYGKENGLYMK